MKRLLGLDIGEKRVGLAISDPLKIFAQGKDVLHIRGKTDLIAKLSKYFSIYEIEKVVIGNPLTKSGVESVQTVKIRKIAKLLEKHYNVETVLWDERYTTKEAQTYLREFGSKKFEKQIDKISAQLILQSYLESMRFNKLDE